MLSFTVNKDHVLIMFHFFLLIFVFKGGMAPVNAVGNGYNGVRAVKKTEEKSMW
jgi:hypothetical protein